MRLRAARSTQQHAQRARQHCTYSLPTRAGRALGGRGGAPPPRSPTRPSCHAARRATQAVSWAPMAPAVPRALPSPCHALRVWVSDSCCAPAPSRAAASQRLWSKDTYSCTASASSASAPAAHSARRPPGRGPAAPAPLPQRPQACTTRSPPVAGSTLCAAGNASTACFALHARHFFAGPPHCRHNKNRTLAPTPLKRVVLCRCTPSGSFPATSREHAEAQAQTTRTAPRARRTGTPTHAGTPTHTHGKKSPGRDGQGRRTETSVSPHSAPRRSWMQVHKQRCAHAQTSVGARVGAGAQTQTQDTRPASPPHTWHVACWRRPAEIRKALQQRPRCTGVRPVCGEWRGRCVGDASEQLAGAVCAPPQPRHRRHAPPRAFRRGPCSS